MLKLICEIIVWTIVLSVALRALVDFITRKPCRTWNDLSQEEKDHLNNVWAKHK
jgi:hypothetical protein